VKLCSEMINSYLLLPLKWIQAKLNFEGLTHHLQFATSKSIGRVAVIGSILGAIFGIHLSALIYFLYYFFQTNDALTTTMIIQWNSYILAMIFFHQADFFVTAFFTPLELSADSFLVNHSLAYTAAFFISLGEFWTRFFIFWITDYNFSIGSFYYYFSIFCGFMLVIIGQGFRLIAMKTCGENFNHIIQHSNSENHQLVTCGIYRYFRHPSYLGYFYWAIGTQILLCNPISFMGYTRTAWRFFSIRIPYEESTLLNQYSDIYVEYMKRTWIGIPFIPSRNPASIHEKKKTDKKN